MSKQQSPPGKSLINLQPMVQIKPERPIPPPVDYMRLTQNHVVNNQFSEYSESQYEAASSTSYGGISSPGLRREGHHNTHRPSYQMFGNGPSARNEMKPRQQYSGRPSPSYSKPFDQGDIDKILQQNNAFNNLFKSGVCLYSVDKLNTPNPTSQYSSSNQQNSSPKQKPYRPDSSLKQQQLASPPKPTGLQQYDQFNHFKKTGITGSFSKRTVDKIETLNSQQQAQARQQLTNQNSPQRQEYGVTYKNLDERDDFMETNKSRGPRFSDTLMKQQTQKSKSNSRSPEKYDQAPSAIHVSNFTENKPHLKKSKQNYPPTPDDNILKTDNFIAKLMSACDNPEMENKLFSELNNMNNPRNYKRNSRSRSPPQQNEGNKKQFHNFIQSYDDQVHQELKNRRGMSPQETKMQKERIEDLKKVEQFIQTIKNQDQILPEYLRTGHVQRQELENKFKDNRGPKYDNISPIHEMISNLDNDVTVDKNITQNIKIQSHGFDMKNIIPKSVDLTDHSVTKMLRTSQGFFRPDTEQMDEMSPPRQQSLDNSFTPMIKNRFDNVQRTSLDSSNMLKVGDKQKTVKIVNKRVGSPEPDTRNFPMDQTQVDLNDRAMITSFDMQGGTAMKKDITQIMQSKNELRPLSPPQALREYQIFKNFEDPEFYNEGSNIDKIVDELSKMDKFASIKWDDKILGVNSNGIVIDANGKEKPNEILPISPQNKSQNLPTQWSKDPNQILKSGLNSQTMVADEIQKCLDQQKKLEETKVQVKKEMNESVSSPNIDNKQIKQFQSGNQNEPKSILDLSRNNRKSIEQTLEMNQLRMLEQEKAAQIKAQVQKQRRDIEEAREKAKAADSKDSQDKKAKGPARNYKSMQQGEMSDELRMKTVFSEKLLRLLYSN